MGAGIAGSTVFHLLKNTGIELYIYDEKHLTACGISSCGWGVQEAMLKFLKNEMGIDPSPFILWSDTHAYLNGFAISIPLYSIDKPKLIQYLIGSANVETTKPDISDFDLVVDATAIRAYSPPLLNEKIATTYQYQVIVADEPTFNLDFIRGGYLWTIPLGNRKAHIGGVSTIFITQ